MVQGHHQIRWLVAVEAVGPSGVIALSDTADVIAHADGVPVLIAMFGRHMIIDLDGWAVLPIGKYRLRICGAHHGDT
jgi:hypothetical protein